MIFCSLCDILSFSLFARAHRFCAPMGSVSARPFLKGLCLFFQVDGLRAFCCGTNIQGTEHEKDQLLVIDPVDPSKIVKGMQLGEVCE